VSRKKVVQTLCHAEGERGREKGSENMLVLPVQLEDSKYRIRKILEVKISCQLQRKCEEINEEKKYLKKLSTVKLYGIYGKCTCRAVVARTTFVRTAQWPLSHCCPVKVR
jgi:hypothetical protein